MDDRWTYLEGRRAGRAYTASLRTPLRPDRWPTFDHHVVISLGYAPHWRTGLPKPKELARLQELEDRMIDGLEGHGALVATETTDATRTVHLYIRGGGPLAEFYRGFGRQGAVGIGIDHDPEWAQVAHLAARASAAA